MGRHTQCRHKFRVGTLFPQQDRNQSFSNSFSNFHAHPVYKRGGSSKRMNQTIEVMDYGDSSEGGHSGQAHSLLLPLHLPLSLFLSPTPSLSLSLPLSLFSSLFLPLSLSLPLSSSLLSPHKIQLRARKSVGNCE